MHGETMKSHPQFYILKKTWTVTKEKNKRLLRDEGLD
jgi:hypothetical protein